MDRNQDFRKGYLASAGENHRRTMDLNAEFFAIEKELASVALQLIDFMSSRHGTIAWDDVMVFGYRRRRRYLRVPLVRDRPQIHFEFFTLDPR